MMAMTTSISTSENPPCLAGTFLPMTFIRSLNTREWQKLRDTAKDKQAAYPLPVRTGASKKVGNSEGPQAYCPPFPSFDVLVPSAFSNNAGNCSLRNSIPPARIVPLSGSTRNDCGIPCTSYLRATGVPQNFSSQISGQ